MHSLEQNVHVNTARRILRIVAPDFRILATDRLGPEDCVLDLSNRTIEISERSTPLNAAAAILFQIGHIRLLGSPEFKEHNGQVKDIGDKRLLARLTAQGVEADKRAIKWAVEVFTANFPCSPEDAEARVSKYAWDLDEWKTYYQSKT